MNTIIIDALLGVLLARWKVVVSNGGGVFDGGFHLVGSSYFDPGSQFLADPSKKSAILVLVMVFGLGFLFALLLVLLVTNLVANEVSDFLILILAKILDVSLHWSPLVFWLYFLIDSE